MPINYKSFFYKGAHSQIGKIILFLLLSLIVKAEGTKEMSPTEDDWVILQLREGFANYGTGGTVKGLNFTVLDATEEVYFAFSKLGFSDYRNISNVFYAFRVVDALGNIVHGPHTINSLNVNGSDYNDVISGPNFGAGGYDISDPIYNFSPTSPGVYHLEFDMPTTTGGFVNEGIVWWDITVTDTDHVPQMGRVHSKNWWFRSPTNGNPDIFAQPFEGAVYVLTDDGFVHFVDFESSGFRGLTFALAFNSSGPGTTGDLEEDRKSIAGLPNSDPEYDIFLNDPDPTLYIAASFGEVILGPFLTSNTQCDTSSSSFCIDYEVTKSGLVEIILDLHLQDGKYTSGTKDRILIDRIDVGDPLRGCVPWDLKDGLGNKVNPFMKFAIFIRYSQGEIHFMMNDVEYNNPGFISNLIHPTGGIAENSIFYDDSNLEPIDQDNNLDLDNNILTGQNPPLVELNGCMMPCHNWNRLTNTDVDGYGESNTVNAWWVGVSPSYPEVSTVTCQQDTLVLTKAVTKIAKPSSGTGGHYDVTWQIIFENNGTTVFDSIQLIDSMAANFGAAFIEWIDGPNISSFAGSPTLPNEGIYPNLFDGVSGELAPRDAIQINFTVELNPSASGTLSILENQAIGQVTNNFSKITSDLSDDVLNSSSDDDPTPARFPKIKLTKKIAGLPAPPASSQNPSSYDVTFEYEIENTGFVDLTNIKLEDNFRENFGGGFVQIVGIPSIQRGTTAQVPGETNKFYTGQDRNIDLLNKEGILKPGEKISISVTAEVVVSHPDAIYNSDGYFENVATATGTASEISPLLRSKKRYTSKSAAGEVFDGVDVMDEATAVLPVEVCDNGIDDDEDGLTDCEDPDCNSTGDIEVTGNCEKMEVKDSESDWSFQWFLNGAPIVGATNAVYAPISNNGYGEFTVEVINADGCRFTGKLPLSCCIPTDPSIDGIE